ncbi:MAG: Rv3235 family protein [Nocardioidaceae bacterium]|nr:Rv3235 family protein [Nocardioidaceae bacterium]MCL2613332.1 Rv3235 family protein [Nocardioidaceae bacterium]
MSVSRIQPPEPTRVAVPVAESQGTLALALLPRQEPPEPSGRAGSSNAVVLPIDRRLRRTIDEWTRRYVQAALEIIGGDRPAAQVLRWTSDEVYADLRRRAWLVGQAGEHQPGLARVQPVRPRLHSVHTCFLSDTAVECSVHVRYGERGRAVAARFERIREHWICTALDFA